MNIKSPEARQSVVVTFRMTKREAYLLDLEAERRNLNKSDIIRGLLMEHQFMCEAETEQEGKSI